MLYEEQNFTSLFSEHVSSRYDCHMLHEWARYGCTVIVGPTINSDITVNLPTCPAILSNSMV